MKKKSKSFHYLLTILFSIVVIFIFSDVIQNNIIKLVFRYGIYSIAVFAILGIVYMHVYIMKTNKKLNRTEKIKDAMLDISEIAITSEDVDSVLNAILEKAIDVVGKSDTGSIMKLKDENILNFMACKGFDEEELKTVNLKLEDSFLYKKTNGKMDRPVIIDLMKFYEDKDIFMRQNLLYTQAENQRISSTISSPIIIDNKLYGMLNLDSVTVEAYTEDDIATIEGFTNVASIILKNHELLKKTIYQSKYDNLTGIYNRHSFEDLVKDIINKANIKNLKLSVVLIDLDDLKPINDTHGHLAGDEILQYFAKTINENIRSTDIFARYGGDEFILVFFNSDEEDIVNKMKSIQDTFNNNPVVINENELICKFSYGIANFPNESIEYKKLIRIADERMYINKNINKDEL